MANASPNPPWLVRLGIFMFHVFVAMIGSTLMAIFLGAIVAYFAGERIAEAVFAGPLFLPFLAVGFFFGLATSDSLNLKSGQWVWAVALGVLLVFLQDQIRTSSPQGILHDIWVDYFGNSNCGGTECAYELVGTWPLFSSIGYSLGSLVGQRLRKKTLSQAKPSGVVPT